MSYGLQVKSFDSGNNEITQIDTTKGYVQYVVTHVGFGWQVNVGSLSETAKIFVKPQTETNGNYKQVDLFTGGPTSEYVLCIKAGTRNGPTIQFGTTDIDGPSDGIAWEDTFNPVFCNYIIIQDVTTVTPVGEYGLQTLTAGNETAFDSRRIKSNTNLSISSVIPAKALGGAAGSTDIISNDSSKYIDISFSFWDNYGTQSGIKVYAGTQQTRYWHRDWAVNAQGQTLYQYFYDNYSAIWLVNKIN